MLGAFLAIEYQKDICTCLNYDQYNCNQLPPLSNSDKYNSLISYFTLEEESNSIYMKNKIKAIEIYIEKNITCSNQTTMEFLKKYIDLINYK